MDRIKVRVVGIFSSKMYQFSSPGRITKQQHQLHNTYRLDDQYIIRQYLLTRHIHLIDLSNDSTSTLITRIEGQQPISLQQVYNLKGSKTFYLQLLQKVSNRTEEEQAKYAVIFVQFSRTAGIISQTAQASAVYSCDHDNY